MESSRQTEQRGRVPEFVLGDRIRKAIESSPYTLQEIADELEVHRNALGRWIHGHNAPSPLHLRVIAELTGVDLAWLRTGVPSPPGLRLRAGDVSPEAAMRRREGAYR